MEGSYFGLDYGSDQEMENPQEPEIEILQPTADGMQLDEPVTESNIDQKQQDELLNLLAKVIKSKYENDLDSFFEKLYQFVISSSEDCIAVASILALLNVKNEKLRNVLDLYLDYPFTPSIRQLNPELHYPRFRAFQKLLFTDYNDDDFSLRNVGAVDSTNALSTRLHLLNVNELEQLCKKCKVDIEFIPKKHAMKKDLLVSVLCQTFKNKLLFSTQFQSKWKLELNENHVFSQDDYFEKAIPTLATEKYASSQDLCYRLYTRFANESFKKINEFLSQIILDLKPKFDANMPDDTARTAFHSKSSHGVYIHKLLLKQIGAPRISDFAPSQVLVNVSFHLSNLNPIDYDSWESISANDYIYLCSIQSSPSALKIETKVKHLRLAKVVGLLGDDGKPMQFFKEFDTIKDSKQAVETRLIDTKGSHSRGIYTNTRTLVLEIDSKQFAHDMKLANANSDQLERMKKHYQIFNVLVKIPSQDQSIPRGIQWFNQVLSDHKHPGFIQKLQMGLSTKFKNQPSVLKMADTYVDLKQLQVEMADNDHDFDQVFVELQVTRQVVTGAKVRKIEQSSPFMPLKNIRNEIKWTENQLKAITSCMYKGLTLIQGPTGSGKKAVATQILSNLLLSNEKILVVCSSVDQIEQLKQNVMIKNPFYSHKVASVSDRFQSIGIMQEKQLQLLSLVDKLAFSLDIGGSNGRSSESAMNFYNCYIRPLFELMVPGIQKYPFENFLKQFESNEADMTRSIVEMFDLLRECAPFEVLKTRQEKSAYYLSNICNVLLVQSSELMQYIDQIQRFKYSSLVMLGNLSELESFVSLEQEPDRVVMIADQFDLGPFFARTEAVQEPISLEKVFGKRMELLKLLNGACSTDIELINPISGINPGFSNPIQFINLEPSAEFIVNLFQYMRLLGYNNEDIVIATDSKSTKQQILDLVSAHCESNIIYGSVSVRLINELEAFKYSLCLIEAPDSFDYSKLLKATCGLYCFGSFNSKKTLLKPYIGNLVLIPEESVADHELGKITRKKNAGTKVHGLEQLKKIVEQKEQELNDLMEF